MNIAVSTLAFMGMSIENVIELARENNLTVEFSSGLPFRKDMVDIYLNADIKRLPHNYFPAPKEPFVLNLASTKDEIRNRSIAHCLLGLELAKRTEAPFYAAHAGFCVDPHPEELGRKLKQTQKYTRDENWQIFINSVKILLEKANELQVDFLIENNVVAGMNILQDGSNPLLCAEPGELLALMEAVPNSRFGILLDTAHLLISARSLRFDADQAIKMLTPEIRAFHHSDNDGNFDTNDHLRKEYWFLSHMKEFQDRVHILEIKNMTVANIKDHMALLESHAI